MEFFRTVMGQRFFEAQLPQLIRAIEKVANELKRANDLKERDAKDA